MPHHRGVAKHQRAQQRLLDLPPARAHPRQGLPRESGEFGQVVRHGERREHEPVVDDLVGEDIHERDPGQLRALGGLDGVAGDRECAVELARDRGGATAGGAVGGVGDGETEAEGGELGGGEGEIAEGTGETGVAASFFGGVDLFRDVAFDALDLGEEFLAEEVDFGFAYVVGEF